MKTIYHTVILTAILLSCAPKDNSRFDTNPAEAADAPGDQVRGNSDTNEEAERLAGNPQVKPVDTSSFVKKAMEAGLTEIGLGQLGARKGKSKHIVDFAERMVKDHNAANDELRALAVKKGIRLSNECTDCESKFKEFANVIMVEFDQRYAKMMVEDHEKAVKLFEEEASHGKDPDLKKWAAEKLPVLKHHLSMAKELNGKKEGL